MNFKIPFLTEDLETYKDLVEQWVSAYGLDLTLKDPQALQQSKLFMELMQTPLGQQILPKAMQLVIQQLQIAQGSQPLVPGGTNGAPVNRVPMA
mgnify:FL=1